MSPWRAAHLRHSNLPTSLTSFIGREQEEEEVRGLLANRAVRLLTLVGPPGIGKTRLSLEVAAHPDVAEQFDDGVFLVELAPISDPTLVVPSIARALSLKESGGSQETLATKLLSYVQDKRMLLVLDNFEQVLDASSDVVRLIQASPWLKVLTTSREALHVRGERRFQVPPLQLPTKTATPDLSGFYLSPAVELFVERARDVRRDFELTEQNMHDVAAICVELDGLPLAIELAAGRANMLSARQMRRVLSSRLKLSESGSRDMPARHKTLRGAIDWSYDLLDDGEKQLFQRMAVFHGGCTLRAVEAVCNWDVVQDHDQVGIDVLDGVTSLLAKNLLQQRAGSDGESRFWMLETIHEYSREKLQEIGEWEALATQHALYFMSLAEESEPHMRGGARQSEWLSILENEHDNVRAALRWAREFGETESVEIGLRTAGAFWHFWYVRGYLSEGREELASSLSADARLRLPGLAGYSKQWRGKALNGVGRFALDQGDHPAARTALEEALSIGREAGDKQSMALSLNYLGGVALREDDYTVARALFEESLLLRREVGDTRAIALSLNSLGIVASTQGDYERARALYEESLGLARQSGDKAAIAHAVGNLGLMAANHGDYQKAHALYEESLLLGRELGDMRSVALSLNRLGNVSLWEHDYGVARALCEESLAIEQGMGDSASSAYTLGDLGNIAFVQEDYDRARSFFRQSLGMFKELKNKVNCAWCIGELGALESVTGNAEQGVMMMGAAEAVFEGSGGVIDTVERIPHERDMAFARARVGEEAFERAWQEGRAMSLEQAIAYALDDTGETPVAE